LPRATVEVKPVRALTSLFSFLLFLGHSCLFFVRVPHPNQNPQEDKKYLYRLHNNNQKQPPRSLLSVRLVCVCVCVCVSLCVTTTYTNKQTNKQINHLLNPPLQSISTPLTLSHSLSFSFSFSLSLSHDTPTGTACKEAVQRALSEGHSVVLKRNNHTKQDRQAYVALAKQIGVVCVACVPLELSGPRKSVRVCVCVCVCMYVCVCVFVGLFCSLWLSELVFWFVVYFDFFVC
jgi:hypothetical protein